MNPLQTTVTVNVVVTSLSCNSSPLYMVTEYPTGGGIHISEEKSEKETGIEELKEATPPELPSVPPVPPPPPVEKSSVTKAPPKDVKVEVFHHRERETIGLPKIFIILVAIIAVVLIAAYLTVSLEQSTPYTGASYPWTTTYEVLFPDGKQVSIGSTSIMALSFQDEVIIDVDGKREKMVIGEERLISERRAIIRALGIPVADTNYQMFVKFIGVEGKNIKLYLTIKTSQQVPQFLIERILPAEIQAKPA